MRARGGCAAKCTRAFVSVFPLPLDLPAGNYHDLQRMAPKLSPVVRNRSHQAQAARRTRDTLTSTAMTLVTLYTQFSTQWDALAHVGSMFDADNDGTAEVRHYNGFVRRARTWRAWR